MNKEVIAAIKAAKTYIIDEDLSGRVDNFRDSICYVALGRQKYKIAVDKYLRRLKRRSVLAATALLAVIEAGSFTPYGVFLMPCDSDCKFRYRMVKKHFHHRPIELRQDRLFVYKE